MSSSLRSVNALSPESTVTSLLSSSGHLTSNLHPPGLSASFTYNDKEYESASAALDAYITDFERSRHGNTPKGAGLGLPLSSPRRSTLSALRNRDVLRERLSEQELDFLSLPVSSLRHRDNRDRVSMMTDELLNLPNDGSMPITHTSAFIHGLVSKSGVSHVKNTCSQSHAPRGSQPIRALHRCGGGRLQRSSRRTPLSSTLKPTLSSSRWAGPVSAPPPDWPSSRDQVTMHLPHWLSSNKAALDCSDVQSLPDLPYPPWVQHCGQSERGRSHSGQSERGRSQSQSQSSELEEFPASAPSWVLELDHEQQVNSETLRNLRLQLAQHISHMNKDTSNSVDSLYRDRRIESLIQKADQVLDSLQNSATGSPVPPVSPERTQDLLLPDLDPGLNPAAQVQDSVGSQPGPLEAIKQILFRLQAVEAELHRRQDPQQGALQDTPRTLLQGAPEDRPQTAQTHAHNPEAEDEEPSLQRALLHLSRLKMLVEKPEEAQKLHKLSPDVCDEERDEGRFSSCSVDDQQGAHCKL